MIRRLTSGDSIVYVRWMAIRPADYLSTPTDSGSAYSIRPAIFDLEVHIVDLFRPSSKAIVKCLEEVYPIERLRNRF